jgi:hypothetical protein
MRKIAPKKNEYIGHIVHTMTRYFDSEPLTPQQIQIFLNSLAVDDIDPRAVHEAYERSRHKHLWERKFW